MAEDDAFDWSMRSTELDPLTRIQSYESKIQCECITLYALYYVPIHQYDTWHRATRIPTCVTRLITANDSGINGRITRKPKSHDIRAICRRSFAIRLTIGIALRVHIISALTLFTVWINRCDFCVADISTKLMLNSMIDDFENVVMSVSLSYHILRGGGHNECVNIVLTSAVDHHLTRALTDISAYAMHIREDWYIFAVSDALPTRWAHIITYAP